MLPSFTYSVALVGVSSNPGVPPVPPPSSPSPPRPSRHRYLINQPPLRIQNPLRRFTSNAIHNLIIIIINPPPQQEPKPTHSLNLHTVKKTRTLAPLIKKTMQEEELMTAFPLNSRIRKPKPPEFRFASILLCQYRYTSHSSIAKGEAENIYFVCA